jgi:TRAP-type uncharacterized transport system fused permease subunit
MEKSLKEQLAEETGSRMRELKGIPAWITGILAAVFSFFYVYTSGFGLISTEVHRGAYLLFFPAGQKPHPDGYHYGEHHNGPLP